MPPAQRPGFRLDLWSAPAPAGGTRTAFLVDAAVGRSVSDVQRTRSLDPGQSRLSFRVAPTHPHAALLQPQAGIVRFTRFVPATPDTYTEAFEEWRIVQRRRPVERAALAYEIVCVPLEDDLLDLDVYREVTGGGLSQWRFGAMERTPAQVLQLLKDRFMAIGVTWVDVGTVTPTQAVTFALEQAATPRAVTQALVDALAAQGVEAEFQCVRANDDSKYLLELVTRVAGNLAPLVATTDAAAVELLVSEDASEQANVVVPFGDDGIDLRELQVEVQAVDAGTGWVTLRAIGATPADVVAVDDQWNGQRLFRELTGRSFAILDSSASPMRVQLAVADLASGLAVGERVSFRASEDLAGMRRAFVTRAARSPLEVVSTLTGPPRINTRDLYGAGASIAAAHQYRDWTAERSTLVATMPETTFDPAAGTAVFTSAPSAAPQVGDWLWCTVPDGVAPLTVTGYNAGTRTATVVARYGGHPYTVAAVYAAATVRCYRPVASAAFWIQASQVSGGQLQVDAFTGGTPAAGDVLELVQRHQGVRVVEVTDPAAIAATRRRVATLEVPCTGATNRLANADLSAWTGGSGDPPDGWTIASIVGTVTRTRVTAPTLTRYGGKAWQLAFAPGASAELFSPLVPAHAVPGLEQVSGALALLFPQFTGNIPVEVTLYRVSAGGTRTALADAIRIFPPDTTAIVDDSFRAALDTWYDAVLTNIGIADLGDESLQFGLRRPAGAGNPACTVVLDAAMLLHREGLPQAAEGGVRYVFGSDATPMLSAAQRILLDRARPLVSFSGRFLDLYRTDALRYAPFELVPGRDVELRVPALGLQRTVRLIATREDPDDPRTAQVTLDRVRPDVGRLLAGKLFPVPPSSLPADAPTSGGLPYATATLARISSTASTVVVQGSASCPGRTPPQVRIASISGGATIAAGPSVGTAAPSGQGWTINRPPASGGGPALVILETVGTGFVGDVALLVIEEQGIELVPLQMRARVLSSDATQVVVRVAVADPLPQGSASVSISYQQAGVSGTSPSSPQTVTPQATLTEAAGTYVDFTIPRPSVGGPLGRVTFTATAANRLAAIDAQDVPPSGLVYAQCVAQVTASSETDVTVTVTGDSALGSPQVKLVSIAGTAVKTAGANAGTLVASGSAWTFSRGAFADGPSQLVFAAEGAGLISDTDLVEVPERGRDTVALFVRARVTASTETDVTVRVAVADPFPQGLDSATIAYVATGLSGISPASGQTVTPAATITEGPATYVDFTVPRPAAGAPVGRVTFTVTAASRVSDSDAVDVPARSEAHVSAVVSFGADGSATLTFTGSPSIASIKYAVSTSAMPSLGTVQAATPADGRNLTVNLSGPYALGQMLYVAALGYSASAGGGQEFGLFESRQARFNATGTKTVKVPAVDGFVPYVSGATRIVQEGFFRSSYAWRATLQLPQGVTLRAVRLGMRGNHNGAGDKSWWDVYLWRGGDGGATLLAQSYSAVNNGTWETVAITSLSENTGGGRTYHVGITPSWDFPIFPDPPPDYPDVAWIEFEYDYPDIVSLN